MSWHANLALSELVTAQPQLVSWKIVSGHLGSQTLFVFEKLCHVQVQVKVTHFIHLHFIQVPFLFTGELMSINYLKQYLCMIQNYKIYMLKFMKKENKEI